MVTRIASLELRNPVILASGLRGGTPKELSAAYAAGAGAVVTKSVTLCPREGHPEPNLVKRKDGGWLNAIGLRNVGAEAFARVLGCPDYPVIVSLAGSTPSEFDSMVRMFRGVAAFEINLSCPNVVDMGDDVGDDPDAVRRIVRAAKDASEVPVFAKVAHHMNASARAAIESGADGITAINTVPAMAMDLETGKPKLSNGTGGLSGPPIKDIAIQAVNRLARDHRDTPIIGCGGISTWRDAAEFMSVGAAAIQVGSAAMDNPNVLGEVAAGLSRWMPREIH